MDSPYPERRIIMNIVRALKLEPGKAAEVVYLETELKTLQEAVGGLIEFCYPAELEEIRGMIMCNEEGKIYRLTANRPLYGEDEQMYDIVVGTCYIMKDDYSGGIESLSNEDIEYIRKIPHLWYGGVPFKIGGEIHWLTDME